LPSKKSREKIKEKSGEVVYSLGERKRWSDIRWTKSKE